jgi:lipoprotein signal peptidase
MILGSCVQSIYLNHQRSHPVTPKFWGIKISLLYTQNSGVTLSFIHFSFSFIKTVESYFGSILAGALEVS